MHGTNTKRPDGYIIRIFFISRSDTLTLSAQSRHQKVLSITHPLQSRLVRTKQSLAVSLPLSSSPSPPLVRHAVPDGKTWHAAACLLSLTRHEATMSSRRHLRRPRKLLHVGFSQARRQVVSGLACSVLSPKRWKKSQPKFFVTTVDTIKSTGKTALRSSSSTFDRDFISFVKPSNTYPPFCSLPVYLALVSLLHPPWPPQS